MHYVQDYQISLIRNQDLMSDHYQLHQTCKYPTVGTICYSTLEKGARALNHLHWRPENDMRVEGIQAEKAYVG